MKIRSLMFLTLALTLFLSPAFSETQKKITNVDWLLMPQNEKQSYMVSTIENLRGQGIQLNKTPQQYIALIDAVTESPSLKPTTIDNIITVSILVNEPGVRKFASPKPGDPEIKKIAMH